ncbi:MAG TPA: ketopantoate reductase family protein [Candidatus Binataceae bacterium]|nr:ketopantoate reductase family protein [Candidatus Binataceae bacterium]
MKILVMGTGAIGAYFGARLQEVGEDVTFCARGKNLLALNERGLQIQSFRGDFQAPVRAIENPREAAPYALILFCVKVYDTDAATESLKECLAPGGAILTLQNGVESESRLIECFGVDAVLGGNARVGVEMTEPGKVIHLSTGVIEFGELDGRETPRAARIAEAFGRAGIFGELVSDLLTFRWSKLLWNSAFNTVTTLTRRTVGELLEDADGMRLVRALMNETLAVAKAEGAKLGPDRIESLLEHSQKNLRALKTSTFQDYQKGKRLEYDALSGAVVRAAHRRNVTVPAMETVHALLKLLDRRLS